MARKLTGKVVSDLQDKTIVVAVNRSVTHPIYGKRYTVTKKFAAHDESNKAHKGDLVDIVETRPISKNKTFKLEKIVETGVAAVELKEEAVEAGNKKQETGAKKVEATPATSIKSPSPKRPKGAQ